MLIQDELDKETIIILSNIDWKTGYMHKWKFIASTIKTVEKKDLIKLALDAKLINWQLFKHI